MKGEEMVEGESYAFELMRANNCVRVKLVSKAAIHPANAIVVRESEGQEIEVEVPRSRIVSTWHDYQAGKVTLVDTEAFCGVAWVPKIGDEVVLDGTVDIRWLVSELNLHEEWVVVTSVLMGRQTEKTVAITEIHPAEPETVPSSDELEDWLEDKGFAPLRYKAEVDDLAVGSETVGFPGTADRSSEYVFPAAVAGRLVFGQEARSQYRRLEPRCRRSTEDKRMRSEIRRKGQMRSPRERSEFIRYHVPYRFEVVLIHDPTKVDGDILIDQIEIRKPRRRKKSRHRQRRRGESGRK